jgi:signal transduction histidine kinase
LLSRRSLAALIVASALLIAVAAASVFLVIREAGEQGWVQHTLEVQIRLGRILSLLQDAQAAQRGYLLLGDDVDLSRFAAIGSPFEQEVEELGVATSDNYRQGQTLGDLKAVAKEALDFQQRTIDLKRSGKSDEALALMKDEEGDALLRRARDVVARMDGAEQRLLSERQRASRRMSLLAQTGVICALALAAVLCWLALKDARAQLETMAAANAALEEANRKAARDKEERERLEAQLRQSQKMEAIGQLTGGIAHDFNNMLAVVIGSLNLLKRRLERGDKDVMRFVDSATEGAERAAGLTNRLLAFSRQQPLAPQPLDVNRLVAGMSEMVRRALGESLQIESVLAAGLWRIHADPGQLESAILNLAVNSRDAMPDGGKLTIETANASLDEAYAAAHVEAPPGQYVVLTVSDTGAGMTPDVVAKAFDPFFTTKAVGKGSGLGLSQVFGFVKQSGGHVKVYSEVGHGTAVKIYLPRFFGDDAEPPRVAPAEDAPSAVGAGAVVLIVEDDERMLRTSEEAFRELGYTVLTASGAKPALQAIDAHPEIALLFTDIVMPEMNGRALADEAVRRRPRLKVIYTTGFTRNAVIHHNVLDPGVQLLVKPFSIEQLARIVRKALDGKPG